jgi:energy-coupling factor transporter ATP-binding protein EcfA2
MNGNPDDPQNVTQLPVADYEVEIYGPPGAGKTILLAALYRIFPQPDGTGIEISAELENRYERLIGEYQFPGRTQLDGSPERLTFELSAEDILQPFQVQVTAHAGEELTQRAINDIQQEFVERQKLLVVVVNPFLHHRDLAWKAFRNLVAVLQNRLELSLKEACYAAADILFQVSREGFIPRPLRPQVEAVFTRLEEAKLEYDHYEPNLEQRFRLTHVPDEAKVLFYNELKPIVTGIVDAHRTDRDRLRNLMAGLDNSMLVLSHADLMDLLSSIRVDDFDDLFNSIFNTPNRNYRRQLLAHNIRLAIRAQLDKPQEGQLGYYVYPAAVLKKSAQQFYQNLKSFAIEAKTGQPGYDEPVELADEHLVKTNKNLVTAVENLHEDLTQLNQNFVRLETGSTTIARALDKLSQLNHNSLKSLSKLKISALSISIIFLAIIQGILAFFSSISIIFLAIIQGILAFLVLLVINYEDRF